MLRELSHPSEVIRNFTPNWFTANMGTGITAVGLFLFPYPVPYLKPVATGLWLFNTALLSLFLLLYLARWVRYPRESVRTFLDPIQSMFFGAIPMAMTTVVDGFVDMGHAFWGQTAIDIAWGLWLVNVVTALVSAWLIPFLMFTRHDHRLETMTALWLIPIVPEEVAAAGGALIIPFMGNGAAQTTMLYFCLLLWALSVPLAFSVLTVLYLRMVLHKLPPREMAVSTWVTLGPIGTGIIGMVALGKDGVHLLGSLGPMLQSAELVLALALWGYGVWWFVMAVLVTLRYLRVGFPFNMGWWGFTFPLGVYTVGTLDLLAVTHNLIFRLAGALFDLLLAGFWAMVASRTAHGAYHGHLFHSPPATVYEPMPQAQEA